jgi:hypothetical protein
MGDLERQEAVEQAANGCLVAVALVLSGVGLAVVEWAARG